MADEQPGISSDTIDRLKKNQDFQKFLKYAMHAVEQMNNLQGLEDMSIKEAGEEAKIRQKTINTLEKVMQPFFSSKRETDVDPEEVKEIKDRVGL